MNPERLVERLRDYRLHNKHFDHLAGAVIISELSGKAVRASVSAAKSIARLRRRVLRAGQYDAVFFIAGEMRSGTSWLRRTLSLHPEIVCGQ